MSVDDAPKEKSRRPTSAHGRRKAARSNTRGDAKKRAGSGVPVTIPPETQLPPVRALLSEK